MNITSVRVLCHANVLYVAVGVVFITCVGGELLLGLNASITKLDIQMFSVLAEARTLPVVCFQLTRGMSG